MDQCTVAPLSLGADGLNSLRTRTLDGIVQYKIIYSGTLSLLRLLGRIRPTRIHESLAPILPRRRPVSAGLHTACGMHASIFFTYSDDHSSRRSGSCPSRDRSLSSRQGYKWTYRSFPAVLKRPRAYKRVINYVAHKLNSRK